MIGLPRHLAKAGYLARYRTGDVFGAQPDRGRTAGRG
jgi:hypothetical protein